MGALEIRGIKYVVSGDNTSVDAANARTAEGMRKLDRQAEQTKIQFLSFGKQGEVTARQLQALGYQTTDIITQLASGQATWLVLLQQGGQLRDQFGGFTNVFKAVAGVLTLGRVAALGATGAFVGLAAALTLGYTESAEFRKQTALSGNAAGLTAGRVDELADSLAKLSGNSKGNARDAVLQLAQGGFTAAGALDSAGRAALALQRVSGESIDDITKRFGEARNSVVRWATEANRSYNYITAAQIEQIRTLEQQGRTQEALRVNFEALAQTMESRQVPALGLLERGWQAVKNAASGAWDAIKAVGRDDTLEQQLDKVRRKIAGAEKSGNGFALLGLEGDRAREFDLARQIQRQLERAGDAAQLARDEQAKIEEASKAHQDALLRIAEAGTAKYLAQQQAAIDARARLIEESYSRSRITPGQYSGGIAAVERARLAAEEAQIRSRIDIERQRKVEGSPAEIKQQEISRTVALIGFETQLVNLAAKRAELESDIKNYRVGVAPERALSAEAQLAQQLETQGYEALAQRDKALIDERLKARQDLASQSRDINIALIQDDQARGVAQLAEEARQVHRRLALWGASAEERKVIEDEFAQWYVLRQRQLAEQLKPEWERRLDLYRDPVRFQRETRKDFMNATTQGGESAWRDMLLEGRDFSKQLKRIIEQELATIGWRKYLAEPFAKLMEIIGNALGVGGGAVNLGTATGSDLSLFYSGHTGGIVGPGLGGGAMRAVSPLVFAAGARRYHGGGLVAGEIPAILQRGEEVLTQRDPRHRYNGGGAPTVVQNIVYNVPDGQSPAAYAAALERNNRALKAEIAADMARPGRVLHTAARR